MTKVYITIRYPTSLRPGDERFFDSGLEVSEFNGRIGIEFRLRHILVSSHDSNSQNLISIKGNRNKQFIALHYEAVPGATIPSRKEIGIFIWKYHIAWVKLLCFTLLCIIIFLPAILYPFENSFIRTSIVIGGFLVIGLPLTFLLGLFLQIKRIIYLWKKLFEKGVLVGYPAGAYGGKATITLIDNKQNYEEDRLDFEVLI